MGVRITMAGQDITDWVDELSLDVESNLGQGPGVPQGASGRATTCAFLAYMGPQGGAYGSGQALPQRNFLSANQASVEGDPNGGFTWSVGGSGSVTRDTTTSWTGSSSLRVVTDGSYGYQWVVANLPTSNFFPGETYTLSVYMKATSAPPLRLFFEANNNIAGNTNIG